MSIAEIGCDRFDQAVAWDPSGGLTLLLSDGQASYIYGPGGLPIEQIDSEEAPTYYHHDQLGSTRMRTMGYLLRRFILARGEG